MQGHDPERATLLLSRSARGDEDAAGKFIPLVYEELRDLASRYLRRERPDHTLQATALVHEAYLRLVDERRIDYQGRTHFLAIAARQMRRVLVDHARAHRAGKRGGGWLKVTLEALGMPVPEHRADLENLEEGLDKLAELDPRQARVVELRFFGGLKVEEAAEVLGVSERTVADDWRMARAWLHRFLTEADEGRGDGARGEEA